MLLEQQISSRVLNRSLFSHPNFLYLGSLFTIVQSFKSVFVVFCLLGDTCDHEGTRISTERVLQDSSQFRVAKVRKLSAIKCDYAVRQREQTFINIRALCHFSAYK